MSRSIERLDRRRQESLFPEFRTDEDVTELPEREEQPAEPPKREPLVLAVMAELAELLSRETKLVREGDFDGFAALQRTKSDLIRKAESLQHNRVAMRDVEAMRVEELRDRVEGFNTTVEANMRAIGAVKDAITHVRTQAIRKLEDEKGDGVYSKDGEKKSLHHLSLNETKVKL